MAGLGTADRSRESFSRRICPTPIVRRGWNWPGASSPGPGMSCVATGDVGPVRRWARTRGSTGSMREACGGMSDATRMATSCVVLLEDPEAAFVRGDATRLKDGRSAQVVAVGRFVVKRLVARRPTQPLIDRVRPGKALRAHRMAFLMEISGLPTAPVAAAGKVVQRRQGQAQLPDHLADSRGTASGPSAGQPPHRSVRTAVVACDRDS